MKLFKTAVDLEKYIVATYYLQCQGTLAEGASALAIGQSIGNPTIRNQWETQQLIDDHSCVILHDYEELSHTGMTVSTSQGLVQIGFPLANIDLSTDGISQLLCQLMGGQMDIDSIVGCRLVDVHIPNSEQYFRGPKYGITGIRKHTGAYSKPLLGGIIKPKVGLSPYQLLEMVKQLVDGGVDFIKEDEIMSNPAVCPLKKRVQLISSWLASHAPKVIYATCITSDGPNVVDRARIVSYYGGNAVHINWWAGLGTYKFLRELDLPLFIFLQKSGDKVITDKRHPFSISWRVLCKLAALSGVDFIHAGMWGGYMHNDEAELSDVLNILRTHDVMPSLSCGMKPELVKPIVDRFGTDFMATSGGYIHGHKDGTVAGTKVMRAAIEELSI